MAFFGSLEAVRARLEGKDKLFVPSLPHVPLNFDLDIAGSDGDQGWVQVDSFIRRTTEARIGQIVVPVYYFADRTGQQVKGADTSLAFSITTVEPRMDQGEAVIGHWSETLSAPVADVYDGDELIASQVPRMAREREIETPVDYMFEIRAYATTAFETAMLIRHVYRVFPPRTFLRVPQADGSYVSWHCLYEDGSFRDLDARKAVVQGTEERQFTKVWTYKIEGYLDNTDEAVLVNLVRKRNLTLKVTT